MLKVYFPEKNTMNNVEERTDGWRDEVQKLFESPDIRERKVTMQARKPASLYVH